MKVFQINVILPENVDAKKSEYAVKDYLSEKMNGLFHTKEILPMDISITINEWDSIKPLDMKFRGSR